MSFGKLFQELIKEFVLNIFLCMRFKKFTVVTPCNTRQILVENILVEDLRFVIDHQHVGTVPSIR